MKVKRLDAKPAMQRLDSDMQHLPTSSNVNIYTP